MQKVIYMNIVMFLALIQICAANVVEVKIDASVNIGKIRALNGGNLGPSLHAEAGGQKNNEEFAALNIPITRLHDVCLSEPGLKIVDTDFIFPLLHADENDPQNYCFAPTDDYIKNTIDAGTQIFFRLGVSIDHSLRKYRTAMPPDAEKWARICIKIIEHYNEGWANGFHFNIVYWEIWNEPDLRNNKNWAGSLDEYNEFYATVSKIIKKRFPNIKIGGPAHTGIRAKNAVPFLKKCLERNAPLDFFSWHCYRGNIKEYVNSIDSVEEYVNSVNKAAKIVSENGFPKAELHLNEWHFFNQKWSDIHNKNADRRSLYAKINGIEAGVVACSTLIAWQDTPLTCGYYYLTGGSDRWGLFDDFSNPQKSYYGFKAFGEITKYSDRLKAESNTRGVYALSGKNASGEIAVLVSALNLRKGSQLHIVIDGISQARLSKAQVLIYDDYLNLETCKSAKINGNTITLLGASEFLCILIKF